MFKGCWKNVEMSFLDFTLFSIYSHSRGVLVGLFFHEYKIKNTKKLYYRTESFFVHFQQLMTLTVKLKNTLSLNKN
jgi:hypothetical protein